MQEEGEGWMQEGGERQTYKKEGRCWKEEKYWKYTYWEKRYILRRVSLEGEEIFGCWEQKYTGKSVAGRKEGRKILEGDTSGRERRRKNVLEGKENWKV